MTEDELFADMDGLVAGLDLVLVDCRLSAVRGGVAVQLVIHGSRGIGTEECAAVHRMAAPRLELIFNDRELRLEVTSPGLERKFRARREYRIFMGRSVWITKRDGHELHGILGESTETHCTITVKGEPVAVPFDDIARAKLEYTEEGESL